MNDPRLELCRMAALFYARGWMAGTAGNLSARLDDGTFWITPSGRCKGELARDDCVRVAPSGEVVERASDALRASDETSIHAAVYASFEDARACFHVHTVESVLAARLAARDRLALPGLEMLKGLGVRAEPLAASIDLFEGSPDAAPIAAAVRDRFRDAAPDVPGFLVRDHGVTVWGPALGAARDRLELLDFLLRVRVAPDGGAREAARRRAR